MMYSDAHCHVNPFRGLGGEVIGKKFKERGGWFIALVVLTPDSYGFKPSYDGYVASIDRFIKECRKVEEQGLKVVRLAGFHPADVNKLITRGLRPKEVYELALRVLKHIEGLVREGVLDGIGEVGRPHFKSEPVVTVLSELIMTEALRLAKDLGVITHLHLEQGGLATVLSVENMARSVGIDKSKVILHHCNSEVAKIALDKGFPVTVVGKKELIANLGGYVNHPNLLIESDYLDDKRRPGVVMYPWEIPEELNKALSEGLISNEVVSKLMIDNVVRIYDVKPP
ncbi:MAG: hydrolase TatD [Thermoprotei archaeon]|nr:MAG: hydrolase TatD [Thermoprotei archaeon]